MYRTLDEWKTWYGSITDDATKWAVFGQVLEDWEEERRAWIEEVDQLRESYGLP